MGIVTLVSGGYDSTLMSLIASENGIPLYPLFIDYGQLGSEKEWEVCQRVHKKFNLPSVTYMDLSDFGKKIPSGLTNVEMRINEDAFLPGRNLLFVLVGASYAFTVQANSVAIGLLNPVNQLFPDQSREFIQEAEKIIELTIGEHIEILTPLIEFSKADVLTMARARGIKDTYSCHAGEDTPCGRCIACIEITNAERRI